MGSRDVSTKRIYPSSQGLHHMDEKTMTVTFDLHDKEGNFIRCEEVVFEVEDNGTLTIRVDEKSTANIGAF